MRYCQHCGKEIMQKSFICPYCGCKTDTFMQQDDNPSVGLNILSFILPIVGLVIYLANLDKTPEKAKSAGKWAIIGFVLGLFLIVPWYLSTNTILYY